MAMATDPSKHGLFRWGEEHDQLRHMVREFAEEVIRPQAMELDETSAFPSEICRQMGELGLMGVPVPEEYEGAGMDSHAMCIVLEEIAKHCGSTALTLGAHTGLGTAPIQLFGTEDQKRRYLPDLASGRKIGAFGLTEPGSGSDAAAGLTTAVKQGDRYRLNGSKMYMTNGGQGGTMIVCATTDRSLGARGFVSLIVEPQWKGVVPAKKEDKLGMRASDTRLVHFEDVEVPEENRIGAEGEGFRNFMVTLDGGRIGVAAISLGLAEGAYDRAVKYSHERVAFGKPIAKQQAVAFKLANMRTNIEAARLLVHHAASIKDAGKPCPVEAAMAKLRASQTAVDCAFDAIQVFGGYGYMKEYEVERIYRDAKLCEIGEGTSEILQLVISREILDES